jgi:glycosyltransferase involved in cell wall biosynthesis
LSPTKLFMSGISVASTAGNDEKLKPVSIGFDAKRAFFNNSGLGNYSRNLLMALAKNYPENSYFLFTPKTKGSRFMENSGEFKLIEPDTTLLKLIRPFWRFKFMKKDIVRHKLQIFHGLSHELPLGIQKTGVKSVVTVHDLIFIRFPEFYNWIDVKIYYWKLVHACRVSDHIVAISNQTKNDLISFLDISPDKITVIHQGCNPCFRNNYSKEFFEEIRHRYKLPERYLLYVGTIEERKNLLGVLKAMHLSGIEIPLVVIGRKVDSYFKKVLNYITVNGLGNIIFPEHVLNEDLPVIYQNSECFIYPSFFEGFGIPVLEALVSKTPVITSTGGCFAEAAGPGSLYVDPDNPEKIGEAILSVVNNKAVRDRMVKSGSDYADNFKDDIIASAYQRLYHSLLT